MSTNPVNNLSSSQLRRAADLRDQIEALEAQLEALLSGGTASAPAPRAATAATAAAPAPAKKKEGGKGKKGKRTLSPEALERIRAGQAKRWAKVRATSGDAPAAPAKKKRGPGRPKGSTAAAAPASGKTAKRKMSAEGRARIQAAVKARWARVAAEKAAAAGAAPKKKKGKK